MLADDVVVIHRFEQGSEKGRVEGEEEDMGGQAGLAIGGEEEQVGQVVQPPLLHEGVHLLGLLTRPKLQSVRHDDPDTTDDSDTNTCMFCLEFDVFGE